MVLREEDENGVPTVYWLAHKTQLLGCAPHHVRADFRADGPGVEQAKVDVRDLKSRGVTRYLDLNLAKSNIDDVHSDEEAMDDDEDVQEPPLQRPRLTFGDDQQSLGLSDCDYSPSTNPAEPSPPPFDDTEPTLLQPPAAIGTAVPIPLDDADLQQPQQPDPGLVQPDPGFAQPQDLTLDSPVGDSVVDALLDETEPSREPSAANTVVNTPNAREAHGLPPGPASLDSMTASYYEPVADEDFASRRRRFNQQETMSFGPARPRSVDRQDGPYTTSSRPTTSTTPTGQADEVSAPTPPINREMNQVMDEALAVMDFDPAGLPEGWYVDDQGHFQTDSNPSDWWEVRSGCLIRHHVVPRRNLYVVRSDPKCPVDLDCLDRIRATMMKDAPVPLSKWSVKKVTSYL